MAPAGRCPAPLSCALLLAGQVAVTASIVFSNCNQISSMISLSTGYTLKSGEFLAVYAGDLPSSSWNHASCLIMVSPS